MDLAEIFRVMCRRWYVLVPGLLLTAGLTAGAWLLVPVSYESQSTVAMLNSRKGAAADGNPFLSMEPSLTGMADSLARNVNSDASKAELKAKGLDLKYEAKIADNAQGPLLWLTVTGDDPDAVLQGNKTLMAFTGQRLKDLQADQSVPADSMIRITTIVPPQDPEAKLKSKVQYLVMAGGLGVVLSLVATFFAEARRRGRAGRERAGDDLPEAPAEERRPHRKPQEQFPEQLHEQPQEHSPEQSHQQPQERFPEQLHEQPQETPTDQPTVQLPVLPVSERRPAKRPPSWVK
ncbi:chain length determinant protein [Streptomyces sp. NPDC053493]|uniref:chain length determinant protein n=1 Tax=Streptomyces sp. NPDC053493 TaxID=3365705 RepID=UPI0037D07BE5